MLKVAVSAVGAALDSVIPPQFIDATHLLILDAESDALLEVIDGGGMPPLQRSLCFARKTVEWDCEALIGGELERDAFAILAEENCVTRYYGAGHGALDGVHLMNDYALAMVTDFIGGTGCPEPDPANCDHHDHGHNDHGHDGHGHGHGHGDHGGHRRSACDQCEDPCDLKIQGGGE